jgi:phosphate transport system substrate-binding protein
LDAEQARPPFGGRAARRALAGIALASAAALVLAACGGGAPPGTPPAGAAPSGAAAPTTPATISQTLSETGSSLMAPLFTKWWKPAYHTQFPQVILNTTSSSSGTGISSAAAGTVDIGASDAYLSPATLAKYPHLVNIPLAVAALMVVYNVPGLGFSTHLKLDGQVLAKIFSGQITRWDDPAIKRLNPTANLPAGLGIVLVHRGDVSGSTFLFTSYMNAQDPSDWSGSLIGTKVAWPKRPDEIAATGSDGSDGITGKVKSSPGSIGYVGVSYKSEVEQDGEGEAELGNSSGNYVLPGPGTIQAALDSFTNTPADETISLINGSGGQAYPIINYEYAVVNTAQPSAARAQDLRAFLSWAIGRGTTLLGNVNFQPLPPSVVTLSEAQIAKIEG